MAAVDVETTGLTSEDRIVSIGAFWLSTAALSDGSFPVSYLHLIFNPQRKSHWAARKVHGFSSEILEKQELFSSYAEQIISFLNSADLVIAHNAAFDLAFVNRELRSAGSDTVKSKILCTMQACRAAGISPAKLDCVCERFNFSRDGNVHGALEDAWLALMVFLWINDCPHRKTFRDVSSSLSPFNQVT
ncbi:DNA polymerase-3 subunit epsilon [Nitrobacter vulgaris]|uniref:3'-5' exonuclease n=1 Tax=Nitrobacter vulgaris TaxID=29421 RepID=UPI0028554595|nr:exonuclease domain-containing protein [Nitrobacter vulgaris]MDR6306411.1 DNA polymerase-3 subunit epsilon [Nitrobacter vulgaris]